MFETYLIQSSPIELFQENKTTGLAARLLPAIADFNAATHGLREVKRHSKDMLPTAAPWNAIKPGDFTLTGMLPEAAIKSQQPNISDVKEQYIIQENL